MDDEKYQDLLLTENIRLKQELTRLEELNREMKDALLWVCCSQCMNGDSPDEEHCDSLLNYPCPVKVAYKKAEGES